MHQILDSENIKDSSLIQKYKVWIPKHEHQSLSLFMLISHKILVFLIFVVQNVTEGKQLYVYMASNS